MGDGVEDVHVQVDEAGDDEQVLRVDDFVGLGSVVGLGHGDYLAVGEGDVAGGVEVLRGVYQATILDG